MKNFTNHVLERKKLTEYFEDRLSVSELKFINKKPKISGGNLGYVAEKNSNEFMIKDFESANLILEFITAPIYMRIAYERVPLIELVITEDISEVKISSKFIKNFQTYREYYNSLIFNIIEKDKPKGAEKIFAAMLFNGEFDWNHNNVGIISLESKEDKITKFYAKVDHGWSATQFFSDASIMLENFVRAYKIYGYENKIEINISEFINAIDEILKISDEEIEILIKSRVTKLKQAQIKIKGLIFPLWIDDKFHKIAENNYTECTFKNFSSLEDFYTVAYIEQKKTLTKLRDRLKSIEEIKSELLGNEEAEFRNGGWIKQIGSHNPIKWINERKNIMNAKLDNGFSYIEAVVRGNYQREMNYDIDI